MNKKVSVIVLTWNGLEFTKRCLSSIQEKTNFPDYEVIVVDNGSSDGTLDYLGGLNWIKLIKNGENLGFAKGNNIGIKHSRGDVVLLNNDVVITHPDWLEKLQEAAYSDEKVGIVGCRLVNGNGHLLHAGTYMPTPSFWGQQIGSLEVDVNQYNTLREVEGVIGACMYIKRSLIKKIGLLDEDYFSYFEDSDYCLKAKRAGFKVLYNGEVQLVHHENTSTKVNKVDFSDLFLTSQGIFKEKWGSYFVDRYETKVMWHSWITALTGYAVTSRSIIKALDDLNVDVRFSYVYGIEEPPSEDHRISQIRTRPKDLTLPQVVYGQGDVFCKNSGRYKIGYTMLEVDGIPEEWVRQANEMNEVWVPSTFNKETFTNSGVRRPIRVMPLGVDPEHFNPKIKSFPLKERFVFLSVFEWGERKAPEVLLRAFNDEFSAKDNIVLILKVTNTDPSVNVRQEIKKLGLKTVGAPPIIILLNQPISDYQMGALYRSANCFVLPTRGEGWGMPILEAMACGVPVICTDWGAHKDFINSENSYPLKVKKLIPAKAKCPYYEGFNWAEPDEEHLRYLMRYLFEHPEEARTKGEIAAGEVLSKWTWIMAAQKIKQRIIEVS